MNRTKVNWDNRTVTDNPTVVSLYKHPLSSSRFLPLLHADEEQVFQARMSEVLQKFNFFSEKATADILNKRSGVEQAPEEADYWPVENENFDGNLY